MAAMIVLTVAGIVIPLAAQLAETIYTQWRAHRAARIATSKANELVDSVVANVLQQIEAAPGLSGVEKRAAFVSALELLAQKTGDPRIAAVAAVGDAAVDVVIAEAKAKAKAQAKTSKSKSKSKSKFAAPSLMDVVGAGHRAQQLANEARRVKAERVRDTGKGKGGKNKLAWHAMDAAALAKLALDEADVLLLVPQILRSLTDIFHVSAATPEEQAAFAQRVMEDVQSAAPAAESAAWAAVVAGVRPTALALAQARAGTLWETSSQFLV
jgi:hypothetical protein